MRIGYGWLDAARKDILPGRRVKSFAGLLNIDPVARWPGNRI
jgi:hypothetical protein